MGFDLSFSKPPRSVFHVQVFFTENRQPLFAQNRLKLNIHCLKIYHPLNFCERGCLRFVSAYWIVRYNIHNNISDLCSFRTRVTPGMAKPGMAQSAYKADMQMLNRHIDIDICIKSIKNRALDPFTSSVLQLLIVSFPTILHTKFRR